MLVPCAGGDAVRRAVPACSAALASRALLAQAVPGGAGDGWGLWEPSASLGWGGEAWGQPRQLPLGIRHPFGERVAARVQLVPPARALPAPVLSQRLCVGGL